MLFGHRLFGTSLLTPVRFIGAGVTLSWDDDLVRALLTERGYTPENLPCTLTADNLEERCGILFIGTGGGRFDEHPRDGVLKNGNTSSVRLLADEMNADIPAALLDLIDYVHAEDSRCYRKTYFGPFELSQIIRTLQTRGASYEELHGLMLRIVQGRVACGEVASPESIHGIQMTRQVISRLITELTASTAGSEFVDRLRNCESDPSMKQLLDYCGRMKKPVSGNWLDMFELATIAGMFTDSDSDDRTTEQMLDWLIRAKFEEQEHYFKVLKPAYDACKRIVDVPSVRGTLRIAFIESELYGLDRCARHFDRAAIIVIRNPETGRFVILTNWNVLKTKGLGRVKGVNQHKTHLDVLIKALRIAERELAHPKTDFRFDMQELVQAGIVEGATNLYYDPRVPSILNGSNSAPNVQPIALSWEDLQELVLSVFDESRMNDECTTTRRCIEHDCPLYALGLQRCFNLRGEAPRPQRTRAPVWSSDDLDDSLFAG